MPSDATTNRVPQPDGRPPQGRPKVVVAPPFPSLLHRYFNDERWAQEFVDRGRFRFSHLEYYKQFECAARGDNTEGEGFASYPDDVQTAHFDGTTGGFKGVSVRRGTMNVSSSSCNAHFIMCCACPPDDDLEPLARQFGRHVVKINDPKRLAEGVAAYLTPLPSPPSVLECLRVGQPNYRNGFRLTLHKHALRLPLSWKKPQTIFVNSMSDLFHRDVPLAFIQEVFAVMAEAHWHTFQVLTKRSGRLAQLAPGLRWADNIWMGVSVESHRYVHRADHLRRTTAAVKFLSLEPLLGPLGDLDLDGIDWVIVGGESGPGARPLLEEWVLDIRDQCRTAAAPFFFKQWGGVFKKRNGRLLEGKTWDEMPQAAARDSEAIADASRETDSLMVLSPTSDRIKVPVEAGGPGRVRGLFQAGEDQRAEGYVERGQA